ncbi:MAG: hypothetical protein AB7N65_17730 [Vicinamibacterales bacterium]
MAVETPGFTLSFEAGADLSSKQYHFVRLDGANGRKVVVCDAVTDRPVGVLQNDPTAGQMATVMVTGISQVVANADLAAGDTIGTSNDGQAAAYVAGTDTTKYIVGWVRDANTAAGGIITAVINCFIPGRAA